MTHTKKPDADFLHVLLPVSEELAAKKIKGMSDVLVKLGHCAANGILCENMKKMVGKNMKYMKLMRTAHKAKPLEQQLPGLPKELNI